MYKGIYEEPVEKPMDACVLQWSAAMLGLLTLLAYVCLFVLPYLQAKAVLASDPPVEETPPVVDPVKIIVHDDTEIMDEDEDLGGKIRMELPEGITEELIVIENDYLVQKLSVRFACSEEDYFAKYRIRGSSDKIATLSYYRDGRDGVVEFGLDAVYELEKYCEDGCLYLRFLSPHEVYDKVVVVDAGHGGKDPGAVKDTAYEKTIDLAILLELKKLFDEDEGNIGVYYTRTEDKNPTLNERVQLANKSNANLFVSIHNNSTPSGEFNGTHGTAVMYSESEEPGSSELTSRRFGQICLDSMVEALGSRRRGLNKGDTVYIIRTSNVPVALIEVGFMTNLEELNNLQSQEYQMKAAEGIFGAIKQAFEEGF